MPRKNEANLNPEELCLRQKANILWRVEVQVAYLACGQVQKKKMAPKCDMVVKKLISPGLIYFYLIPTISALGV